MKKISSLVLAAVLLLSALLCALPGSVVAEATEVTIHLWDFEDGISGWSKYVDNSATFELSAGEAETKTLAFDYTYSTADTGNWPNSPIFTSPQYYVALGEATHLCFDIYAQKGGATTGNLIIYPTIQSPEHSYWFALNPVTLDFSKGEDIGNNLLKYSYSVELKNTSNETLNPTDIINCVVFTNCGAATNYSGTIMYDNIRFVRYEAEPEVKDFTFEKTELSDTVSLAVGDTLTVTAVCSGGVQPYHYTYYALKDGHIMHKSAIWTGASSEDILIEETGNYTILVYSRDATGVKQSVKTVVSAAQSTVKPQSISLSAATAEVEKDETLALTATITPADAVNKTIKWTSSNESVATVDENGVVTGILGGTATITATTFNGLTASCEVTVKHTIPAADKYIALTFDDGPDSGTGAILDTLAQYNAKATFFVLYTNAQYNTSLVQRMANEGHELGNHTKTHSYLTQLTEEAAKEEINFVNDFVYDLTGITPTLYRPPYLSYDSTLLSYFPDMSAIGCSIDTKDWAGVSAEEITNAVLNGAQNGSIVLMHVTGAHTKEALPDILEGLAEKGYACVTVSELFEATGRTITGGKYYSSVWG